MSTGPVLAGLTIKLSPNPGRSANLNASPHQLISFTHPGGKSHIRRSIKAALALHLQAALQPFFTPASSYI